MAWALGRAPLDPLIVIAMSSMLCVYSVGQGEAIGYMRGHGGACIQFSSGTLVTDFRE